MLASCTHSDCTAAARAASAANLYVYRPITGERREGKVSEMWLKAAFACSTRSTRGHRRAICDPLAIRTRATNELCYHWRNNLLSTSANKLIKQSDLQVSNGANPLRARIAAIVLKESYWMIVRLNSFGSSHCLQQQQVVRTSRLPPATAPCVVSPLHTRFMAETQSGTGHRDEHTDQSAARERRRDTAETAAGL